LAAANNQGLLAATGEAIVISNPDVVFTPGALDELVGILDRRTRAAFALPRVTVPDGSLQSTAGDLPSLGEALLGRQVARWRARPGSTKGFCWDGWAHDEERKTGRAGDVCYMARRSAIAEIGLQDERFPLDWEGLDWSARARDAGWEIWFCPAAGVVHAGGASTGKAPPIRWVLKTHRGMHRYFRNRRPALGPALSLAFALRAGLKGAAVLGGVPMHELARRAQRTPGAKEVGSRWS
jgi:N-acetylglucosaminyl-diphospho-decaprenol L-rhamnosyltransferase